MMICIQVYFERVNEHGLNFDMKTQISKQDIHIPNASTFSSSSSTYLADLRF